MTTRVYVQLWEESERGWGCRPDGVSLHKSKADCDEYIEEYWEGMPPTAPDEYSRPCSGRVSWRHQGGDEHSLTTGYVDVSRGAFEALKERLPLRIWKLKDVPELLGWSTAPSS